MCPYFHVTFLIIFLRLTSLALWAILGLPPVYKWSTPEVYMGESSREVTTTKHNNARTVCKFNGKYLQQLVWNGVLNTGTAFLNWSCRWSGVTWGIGSFRLDTSTLPAVWFHILVLFGMMFFLMLHLFAHIWFFIFLCICSWTIVVNNMGSK